MESGIYRSRLKGKFDEETARFISSMKEDERIFEEDINGTEAHDIMLFEQGIITQEDLKKILFALEKVRLRIKTRKLKLSPKFEDIHEFIEAQVIKEIGVEVGGKLHSGRSRNDQVAVDLRMRVRSELNKVSRKVLGLVAALLKAAEKHIETLMALYTHTQPAQTGIFAHYLLAYADMLLRDFQRLQDCYTRVNRSPLGAGPIGGSSLSIDRNRTASLLGFDGVLENSIDAVSSRDFALEVAGALATLMSGLSRMAEDFIVWSSAEFGYLEIADEYASTSSVMPQKKNPCTLELVRGKTGRVYGALTSLLTMTKGVLTGYNRDLQETKQPLWTSFDATKGSLDVLAGIVSTLKVNRKRMRDAASESYVFAMDLAEQLVQHTGISFREAHILVGKLVKEMVASGVKPRGLRPEMLEELAVKVLRKKIKVSPELVRGTLNLRSCLVGRKTLGGPSLKEVKRMLRAQKKLLAREEARLASRIKAIDDSERLLRETVKRYTSD
jgi:argininosuccinate lyase